MKGQCTPSRAIWMRRVGMDSAELAALHFDKDIVISQAAQGAQGPCQGAFVPQ